LTDHPISIFASESFDRSLIFSVFLWSSLDRRSMPRRDDLLTQLQRQIAVRARAEAHASIAARQTELAKALDSLNAYDALDTIRRKRFTTTVCFGPRPYMGTAPHPWVGVLIWKKAPGYYGYKTLMLYGAWAIDAPDAAIAVVVGSRPIPYTSDFYVAEAYFKLIRESFDDYYSDDASPPDGTPLFTVDRARRLEQRDLLVTGLARLT